LNSGQEDIQ